MKEIEESLRDAIVQRRNHRASGLHFPGDPAYSGARLCARMIFIVFEFELDPLVELDVREGTTLYVVRTVCLACQLDLVVLSIAQKVSVARCLLAGSVRLPTALRVGSGVQRREITP